MRIKGICATLCRYLKYACKICAHFTQLILTVCPNNRPIVNPFAHQWEGKNGKLAELCMNYEGVRISLISPTCYEWTTRVTLAGVRSRSNSAHHVWCYLVNCTWTIRIVIRAVKVFEDRDLCHSQCVRCWSPRRYGTPARHKSCKEKLGTLKRVQDKST